MLASSTRRSTWEVAVTSRDTPDGRAAGPIADLPVEHLDPRAIALGGCTRMLCGHRLRWTTFFSWAKRTTSAICRIRSRRTSTPRRVLPLREVVIKADRQRVMLEDEGRPELVLGEAVGAEDAGVLEGFEELELALGGASDDLPVLFRGPGAHEIQPDPPFGIGELYVGGQPILVARTLFDQLVKDVVADLTRRCEGRMPACSIAWLMHLGGRAIMRASGVWVEPGTVPLFDRRHNAGPRRCVSVLLAVPQADAIARRVLQLTAKIWSGAEDQRLRETGTAPCSCRPFAVGAVR